MSLEFQFETFVDVYHSIFSEYLSSVVAKLPKENEKYRAMKEELSSLYDKYPKILDIFDMDKAEGLSAEECAGLVKVLQLRNELTDMELQSVYFRGCYDGVGYLKKAGIFPAFFMGIILPDYADYGCFSGILALRLKS